MPVFRRSQMASTSSPEAASVAELGYWKDLVNLIDFMSSSTWPDGTSRATGTVMLFREGGAWKAWLHDRDALHGCFLSAPTLVELLERCDECVGEGSGDWRPDGKKRGKGG